MKTRRVNDKYGLPPFLKFPIIMATHSLKTHIPTTDTHTIYSRVHHILHTSITTNVYFVQLNHHTISQHPLRFCQLILLIIC